VGVIILLKMENNVTGERTFNYVHGRMDLLVFQTSSILI